MTNEWNLSYDIFSRTHSPFAEIATRNEQLFGPSNGRIVRAAKIRRKELDELKLEQPSEFQTLLQKYGLDQLTEDQNALDADAADIAAVDSGSSVVADAGLTLDQDDGDDLEDGSALFWNKPGSKVMADKETQKKYRMQRNPLPLETDKLLCKHVLGGDLRFALLCNSRPSLFGLPNSRERRKIDDRRRLLREMMAKRPVQFVDVCRAHGLDSDLVEQGLVRSDGTLNEAVGESLLAADMDPNNVGRTLDATTAASLGILEEMDEEEERDMDTEDKSPTKAAAISLQALRRKGIKMPKSSVHV
jgi:hypothetical protein